MGNTVTTAIVTELPPDGTTLYGQGFTAATYPGTIFKQVNPTLIGSAINSANTGGVGQIWSSLILQYTFDYLYRLVQLL
jgi:hypothetical protein